MAFGRQTPSPTGSEPGLREELVSFVHGLKAYVAARAELLNIETREAVGILGKKAGLGVLAAFFLIFGYLLFLVFAVGLLGQLLTPGVNINLRSWLGGAFILSACHLLAGFGLLFLQKRTKVGTGLFEITRAELKNDQEWLNNGKES